MKKIKVWDNLQKRFLELHEFSINGNGDVVLFRDGKIFDVFKPQERYVICSGMCKTDIDGNEIYAESSIVEFDFEEAGHTNKVQGYFYFKNFSYRFKLLKSDMKYGVDSLPMYFQSANTEFKIIGTLQQDKHLLGKEK